MDLTVKIRLKKEWMEELDKHPMIRKHLRGFIEAEINQALIGRGKVISIKFDNESN